MHNQLGQSVNLSRGIDSMTIVHLFFPLIFFLNDVDVFLFDIKMIDCIQLDVISFLN
jgi:hypothetical protein